MATSSRTTLFGSTSIAVAAAAAASMLLARLVTRRTRRRRDADRDLTEAELWVSRSIATSMPPASKLGIDIGSVDDSSDAVSLIMPLRGNTNPHGCAFAGSLYSLSALSAWYALVLHLRRNGLDEKYAVVMQSANISYLRPVSNCEYIVARSTLPPLEERRYFFERLEKVGKAMVDVSGAIVFEGGKMAVEYTATLCAFLPRKTMRG